MDNALKARQPLGLMASTVYEAVGSLANAELCERVIEEALRMAGSEYVPEEAERARAFVEGPLKSTVEHFLGDEAADVVVGELTPTLDLAASHVRSKSLAAPVTSPQSHGSQASHPRLRASSPLVLVSSRDRLGFEKLSMRLGGRCSVRSVEDVLDLMLGLEMSYDQPTLIILDCCAPSVDLMAVARMLPDLSHDVDVVLWGADDAIKSKLTGAVPEGTTWLFCDADATHEDLAHLLESRMDTKGLRKLGP